MSWEALWYGPPSALTWLLRPLSWLYGLAARAWHLAWDVGLRRPVRVAGARVVSVGNLVAGGAGKTPLVIHLAQAEVARGQKVAVLTRGYGRTGRGLRRLDAASLLPVDEVGDEPRLIARACPGAVVWVGADRVEAARRAVAEGARVLLLDDGFQHRRLARDVDVVLLSGEGNGCLLPAGPLREPRAGLRRATVVWRRDVEVRFELVGVRAPSGERHAVDALAGRPVVLLVGVARPRRVQEAVGAHGARIVAVHAYADHHPFSGDEVARARAEAERAGAWLVTTAKDAERLEPGTAWVLELEATAPPLPG